MKYPISLSTSLIVLASVVHAQSAISVNFHESVSANQLGSTDAAGVVPVANWNNVLDDGADQTIFNLKDSSGATTTMDMFMNIDSDISNGTSNATSTTNGTAEDRTMMADQLATQNSITLQFSDLPTAYATSGIDIYLYSWGKDEASGSGNDRYSGIYRFQLDVDGPGAGGFQDAAYMRNYDPTDGDQNWPGFSNEQFATQAGVTASSYSSYAKITLAAGTFDATDGFYLNIRNIAEGGGRNMLQGLQVVAIPEPSAYALLSAGLAFAWVMLQRRRG